MSRKVISLGSVALSIVQMGPQMKGCWDSMLHRVRIGLFSFLAALLAVSSTRAVNLRTGFEPEEGYSVGKLTPSQPSPVGDVGWGNSVWTDLGGNNVDPQGFIVASADAPQGLQYYQRLGGGNNNLAIREFPAISVSDGDFSIRWQVRIDTDQATPPYFANFATIEVDDTGPGGRIMTFRYDDSGDINLSSVQNGIAKWDGTGDPAFVSALNQFVKGGLNVYWATKEIEVFMEDSAGQSISVGTFSFREANTDQVDRIFLGVGPGGTAQQGVSWDDIIITSELLPEPVVKPLVASNPNPADGALVEATWANLSWSPGTFAASHDVYLGDSFDDVNEGLVDTFTGNQPTTTLLVGFPSYPFPDGLVPGTTYYWRVDEINDAEPNSPWTGDTWSFSVPPKTAYNPDPADGAEFVDLDAILSWTGGYGAKLHTVYIGDSYDDVNNATEGASSGTGSYDPGTLEREKILYWRVDEFDGLETHKGDIWAFTTPGAVGNPQPANVAVDVQMSTTLNWTAADNASSHELYFGTDADAVENATTASSEYIGPRALGAVSYDPGGLDWGTNYAWRVDEVYPTGTVKGLVWTFTTADFIIVDDFESYDDIDPLAGEPGVNRIFDKWIDGFGTTTNGAIVGNDLPPYAERSIVHGGAQSLVYRYDNAGKTSEATLTLVYPRDWTAEDVTKLSLWVRGGTANAADRIYVALNGTAVVYHDDPAATQLSGWNKWVIDLAAFGVNLTNVNAVTIGVGTKNAPAPGGGQGTLYFDDIRLYR